MPRGRLSTGYSLPGGGTPRSTAPEYHRAGVAEPRLRGETHPITQRTDLRHQGCPVGGAVPTHAPSRAVPTSGARISAL